jgi:hypothetical protein
MKPEEPLTISMSLLLENILKFNEGGSSVY